MKTTPISLNIPDDIYRALAEIAENSRFSLQEVYILTLRNGMPPMLKKVPEPFHPVLLALNRLDDGALWDVLSGRAEPPAPPEPTEQPEDFKALWRAYAFALLKWRGHPVPDPHEFIS